MIILFGLCLSYDVTENTKNENWIPGSRKRRSRLIEATMLRSGCVRCHIAMSRPRLMNKGVLMAE